MTFAEWLSSNSTRSKYLMPSHVRGLGHHPGFVDESYNWLKPKTVQARALWAILFDKPKPKRADLESAATLRAWLAKEHGDEVALAAVHLHAAYERQTRLVPGEERVRDNFTLSPRNRERWARLPPPVPGIQRPKPNLDSIRKARARARRKAGEVK